MKKWLKMFGVFLLIVLVIGGMWGYNLNKTIQGFKNAKPQVQTVSTIVVNKETWARSLQSVGSLRAVNGVELTTEAPGIVDKINFKSGANVEKGAVILILRANEERARLNTLRANAKLAQANFARDKQQFEINAISKATYESSQANSEMTASQVNEQEATLAKKVIRAPFAGKLGIINLNLGELLPLGYKVATLQNADFLFVDFYLPQEQTANISVGQKVTVSVDAVPDKNFVGKIEAIDSKVDNDTRNILLRAKITNEQNLLFSGMFVNVSLELDGKNQSLVIPQSAVSFNPYGQTVFVVTTAEDVYKLEVSKLKKQGADDAHVSALPKPADGKALSVKQVSITTGAKRGDQIEVLSGLDEGAEVVTSGQIKLKNGSLIKINNKVQPTNDANPQPIDK